MVRMHTQSAFLSSTMSSIYRGIAFEAKPTSDGTWHGFPVPWESVPPAILRQWLQDGKVTRRQVKLFRSRATDNIRWALGNEES